MKYLAIAFTLLGLAAASIGQAVDETSSAGSVEQFKKAAEDRRADLFQSYAQAVERLQAEFQEKGDIVNLLKARSEVAKVREKGVMGSEEFPGVVRLRDILKGEFQKIDLAELQGTIPARRSRIEEMRENVVELTKAGNLDEAQKWLGVIMAEETALANEENKLAAMTGTETPGPPKITMETPPPPPAEDDLPESASTELKRGETAFGHVVLAGGQHRLRDTIQIGARDKHLEEEKGFLTVKDRAEVTSGGLHIHFGWIKATDSLFENVAISEALQGTFTAERCLFENCTFQKKGPWVVRIWGSKWHFTECVFHRSFFIRWNAVDVALQINDCTFIGVDFPTYGAKEDGTKEAVAQWQTIKNCRFINCKVPISILASTENCVFENCRFVKDDPDLFPMESELKVKAYFTGVEEPKVPSTPEFFTIEFESAGEAQKDVGCPGFYALESNKLLFR